MFIDQSLCAACEECIPYCPVRAIHNRNGEMVIDFDGRSVTYGFSELDEVIPAYAISVHKSQGSEYPAVIVPVSTQHYLLLQRNLLYTAITRAKKLVVLIGTQKALAMAIRNSTSSGAKLRTAAV